MAVVGILSASKGISDVLRQAWSLYSQLQEAKTNKKRFVVLANHVKEVAEVLKTLEEQGVDGGVVKTGLEIFERAMESANKLLQDYESSNWFSRMCFKGASGWKDCFAEVDDQLGKAKQHLTLAIQVEQRGQSQVNQIKREEEREASGESVMLTTAQSYSN